MSAAFLPLMLGLAVGWPLLLALPAIGTRIPWCRLVAVVPALLLTISSGDARLELPSLLLGTGFQIDGQNRWMVGMAAAVWFAAAQMARPAERGDRDRFAVTFRLLTLTGNLGAILATDLVGFFSFATVMGYGFYGVLLRDGGRAARRSGRSYLVALVVADLLLFEALLLAAFTTEDLRFPVVAETMAGAPSATLYLWLVLIGFLLRAGAWPLHGWLEGAFRSVPRTVPALLLGSVPIATGLLGVVRWLPLGEWSAGMSSLLIQLLGAAAVLHVVTGMPGRAQRVNLPASFAIGVTGLFIMAVGNGLADPPLWRNYEVFAFPFIALLGALTAVLGFVHGHLAEACPFSPRESPLWSGRWIGAVQRWSEGSSERLRLAARTLRLKLLELCFPEGRNSWRLAGGWGAGIIAFVLLGLMLAWLAV